MNLLYLVVVGLIAGRLADRVMKGGGYGIGVDLLLGVLGGVFGGWTFAALGIWPGGGILPAILVGFLGAMALIWIARLLIPTAKL
jgi:uncharacterized membrane protein YeaQ/YmgE (transglycosylase-associated protein family)